MSIWDFIFADKPARVSKKAKKKAERFIIEKPESPVSSALLRSTKKSSPFGSFKVWRLQREQLKRLYPFIGR